MTIKLTIFEGGNVGIETTTPNYELDVNGDINIASGSKYKINGADLNYSDLAGTPPSAFTLPTASATTLGGIKVGNNLSISNGVLSSISFSGSYTDLNLL